MRSLLQVFAREMWKSVQSGHNLRSIIIKIDIPDIVRFCNN